MEKTLYNILIQNDRSNEQHVQFEERGLFQLPTLNTEACIIIGVNAGLNTRLIEISSISKTLKILQKFCRLFYLQYYEYIKRKYKYPIVRICNAKYRHMCICMYKNIQMYGNKPNRKINSNCSFYKKAAKQLILWKHWPKNSEIHCVCYQCCISTLFLVLGLI